LYAGDDKIDAVKTVAGKEKNYGSTPPKKWNEKQEALLRELQESFGSKGGDDEGILDKIKNFFK